MTTRQQAVLTALDEQIADLEAKLARYQPLLEELAQLKRVRATLLGERLTGGRKGTLTTEAVLGVMGQAARPLSPLEIAERTGAHGTVVRSHLSRWQGKLYRRESEGWIPLEGTRDRLDHVG